MELKNADKLVKKFRDYVIKESRSNLTRMGKNASNSLYQSLRGTIDKENNYYLVGFQMMEYGDFVDKGVKGAFPSLVKGGVQKAPNSPYKFGNKMPPREPLIKWAKLKGIKLRDKKGRFKKGGLNTLGFLLQRSIYAQGIKPSLFFTKAFENGYNKYIKKDLAKAFASDVEAIVDYNLKIAK
jgi:hypothetical protein